MQKIAFLGLLSILVCLFLYSFTDAAAPFTAANGKIFYPDGSEYKIVGMNMDLHSRGLDYPARYITDIELLKSRYKVNFLRVYDHFSANPPVQYYDQIVNAATAVNTVTEFEFHGTPGQVYSGTELNQAADWYRLLSARYKDNPYVWFASINESGGGADGENQDAWFNSIKVIHDAVRAGGNVQPFLIDDCGWGVGTMSLSGDSCIIRNKSRILAFGGVLIPAPHAYTYINRAEVPARLQQYMDNGFPANVVEETGAFADGREYYIEGMRGAIEAAFGGQTSGVVLYAWRGDGTFYGPLSPEAEAAWSDFGLRFGTDGPGSTTPTPTPTPAGTPCHGYQNGSTIPSGFGMPWDLFNPTTLLLKVFCGSQKTAQMGPATYIYHQGYAWNGTQWIQQNFTCTGGAKVSNAWCPTSAQVTLPANTTFYAAYTCQYMNNQWKCGCRDTACTTNYWQLQKIN